jgi:hypothetical protein
MALTVALHSTGTPLVKVISLTRREEAHGGTVLALLAAAIQISLQGRPHDALRGPVHVGVCVSHGPLIPCNQSGADASIDLTR